MTRLAADGILLVDKPAGITSHDVIDVARRAIGTRRIGHTGTLDPFATGLLVLLVGRATRLLPYVDGEPKVYEATFRFGVATDTDDATGTPIRQAPLPAPAAVADAIQRLSGSLDQRPPAYSAKQIGGERAYVAARGGNPLTLPPVPVRVDSWVVHRQDGTEMDATVTCSGGTYVRSLARDLGELAGSAAHLARLRRTRSGPFSVEAAQPLDELTAGGAQLLPVRAAIHHLPSQTLDDDDARRIAHGQSIPAAIDGPRAALLAVDGDVLAVADREADRWQPRLVLRGSA